MYSCDDIRASLTRGELPAGHEAEEHLASCPGCRDLLAGQAALGAGLAALGADAGTEVGDTADAWVALEGELSEEQGPLAWLRNRGTSGRVAIALGVAVVLVAAYLGLSRRADWGTYPVARWAAEGAVLAAVLLLVVRQVLRPLHLPARSRAQWGAAAGAFALPMVLAWAGPAHVAHPASLEGAGADFWPRALACLALGASVAVPLLVVLHLADRLPGRRFGLALLAAGAGGLTGNLVLHAHCAITDPLHLLVGHAAAGVVLVPAVLLVAWLRARRV